MSQQETNTQYDEPCPHCPNGYDDINALVDHINDRHPQQANIFTSAAGSGE